MYHNNIRKEFITLRKLDQEIQEEIMLHSGRVNWLDLPAILRVQPSVIEDRIPEILKRNTNLRLVGTDIVSGYFLAFCVPIDASGFTLTVFVKKLTKNCKLQESLMCVTFLLVLICLLSS